MLYPERESSPFEHPIYYPKLFTPEECNKIINFAKSTKDSVFKKDMDKAYQPYSVKSYFLDHTNPEMFELLKKMQNVALSANSQYYNFEIARFSYIFILEYLKGAIFGRHIDISNSSSGCPKVSVIIFLSDENDYTGGRLLWPHIDPEKNNQFKQEQGTMVMFPSYLCHEVSEVFSGQRYVLTGMLCGDKMFK